MSLWHPLEISMAPDVRDWGVVSDADRRLIGGILRGFTLAEQFVGCYWGETVARQFPKPEILAMARLFSYQETIHQWAYSHLSDTLGIDEWEAYQGDPSAQDKIAFLMSESDPVVSLGVFSGAVEGMSLISSFVVLLSYCQTGKFKGLNQILSWSNIDELNHSSAGCRLFRELDKEGKVTPDHKWQVTRGFDAAVQNEIAFLENAYAQHPSPPIPLWDVVQYVSYRANQCFKMLGIDHRYKYSPSAVEPIIALYETQMKGSTSTDFFAQQKSASSYTPSPTQFTNTDQLQWNNL